MKGGIVSPEKKNSHPLNENNLSSVKVFHRFFILVLLMKNALYGKPETVYFSFNRVV